MQPAPTGWYHAEGDAEGTVRYWDGTQWVGGPVNSPSATPPGGGGGTGYTAPSTAGNPTYAGAAWQQQATTAYGTYGYSYVPFIERCYPADQLVTASRWRRLGAAMLDGLLQVVTLWVGWWIWFIFTAQNGQTPAKKILGMYVMKSDGSRAGGGDMWLRELVIKVIVGYVLGAFTFIYSLIAPMWCLWDKDRQCIWDKMASTYVAHSPYGFKPSTKNELMMMGQPAPAFRPRPEPGNVAPVNPI